MSYTESAKNYINIVNKQLAKCNYRNYNSSEYLIDNCIHTISEMSTTSFMDQQTAYLLTHVVISAKQISHDEFTKRCADFSLPIEFIDAIYNLTISKQSRVH